MQLRIDGTEVPADEVDSGPERETDRRYLRVKREVARLADAFRRDRRGRG